MRPALPATSGLGKLTEYFQRSRRTCASRVRAGVEDLAENPFQAKPQRESIRFEVDAALNELLRFAGQGVVWPVMRETKNDPFSHLGASKGNLRVIGMRNPWLGLFCKPWSKRVVRESTGHRSIDFCRTAERVLPVSFRLSESQPANYTQNMTCCWPGWNEPDTREASPPFDRILNPGRVF
jgi:hypothetical protein